MNGDDSPAPGTDADDLRSRVCRALDAVGSTVDPGPVVESARQRLARTDESGAEARQAAAEAALVGAGAERAARWAATHGRVDEEVAVGSDLEVDLSFSLNALKVLEHRYLRRDARGRLVETPDGMLRRVAEGVAAAEAEHGGDPEEHAENFYHLMRERVFLPNSPTLMNAGTDMGQLSACFVIPVPDSLDGIFDALKAMALIHQSGGGTGFAFSRLRPAGDVVRSTGGVASGPVSFMRVFDTATDVVRQGGRRRGANMAVLRVDHPDILEFVRSKRQEGAFRNFNISVGATDEFMDALERGDDYALRSPRTGAESGRLDAREAFAEIVSVAWETGDPGLVFLDRINRRHPVPGAGTIEATNPCGEQPLLSYEPCNLGSLNLARLVRPGDRVGDGELDEERLRRAARTAVRFLDDVIDVNRYPLDAVTRRALQTRKIGLGIMGFAEALARCGIPYDSPDALRFARRVMAIVADEGHEASAALARDRGPFPAIDESVWPDLGYPHMRNATVTTVAPTGTISILADTSSGIEPFFALAFLRNVMEGVQLREMNATLVRACEERDVDLDGFRDELVSRGSLRQIEGAPEPLRRLFPTAFDVDPEQHVRIQAAFQEQTDNAVSKTINLPAESTEQDVERVYRLAWETGCKGITVFRYGSKGEQVLEIGGHDEEDAYLTAGPEYAGECRFCAT